MNRLKLKVKNTEKLYDICLKDVCLRGQLPQAVLLIGSQMLSPSATATSPAPHHTSDPQSLDVKSEGHESREAVYDAKGSKDETEEEDKSGVKSMPNYDFPLPNDWREAQDLQTVENQRIRNQIKLNVDVPSFIETNLTSITPSLSLSSSWTPGSGVRAAGARMKSGSHSGPGVAFLSFPSSPPSPHRPASSRVSVSVAGSVSNVRACLSVCFPNKLLLSLLLFPFSFQLNFYVA